MRIKKVSIHNYRSIRDLTMDCGPLVVLLGPNNHGKSNIISALEYFLNERAKLVETDFFFSPEGGKTKELWIEVTFVDLTEQEGHTFKKYILEDGSVRIRKYAKADDGFYSFEVGYRGYVDEPDDWWLKGESLENLMDKEVIDGTPLKALFSDKGKKLTKKFIEELQAYYIEEHKGEIKTKESMELYPLLGAKNVASGILPELLLIPAVRDLSDETKIKSTTVFGRLLDTAVKETLELDPAYQHIKDSMTELTKTIKLRGLEKDIEDELRDQWEEQIKVGIEVEPPSMQKIFEGGTDLILDDGVETSANQKGHGLQRAVLFALLKAWSKALKKTHTDDEQTTVPRRASDSVFFAIEEPELYLHPHAQRRLSKAIQDIAETPQHQIFICTHSTHFLDLNKYKSICIIRKDNIEEGTKVLQCQRDLFEGTDIDDKKRRFHMAHWVNPDRGEMFFAKRIVFVEGETEKVVLSFVAGSGENKCFNPEVSIIDCGGKSNLPLYINIANAFKLKYIVVHDEDPLPDENQDGIEEKKKESMKKTFALNETISDLIDNTLGRIEIFSPEFEDVIGVSRSQRDRLGKPFAALEFLQNKLDNGESIPQRLSDVVLGIYQEPC